MQHLIAVQGKRIFQSLRLLNTQRLLIALILLVVADTQASILTGQIIGKAYPFESETLLYSETHCLDETGTRRDIYYRDYQGTLLAYKTLDYLSGKATPSFVQHNYYSAEKIEVSLNNNRLTMTTTLNAMAGKAKTLSIKAKAKVPLVIDAGFDAFVVRHWDALVAGQRKRFLFPVTDQRRLVQLRLTAANCSYASDNEQCFSLEVDNFFLRILVQPIELGYQRERKRLSRYRGLSNIGNGEGAGQEVDIRYNYQPLPATACTTAG